MSRLLWVDCSAGAAVGLFVLLLHGWVAELYGLPLGLTLFIGAANLGYGVFSLSLALQQRRSYLQFKVLVGANLLWAALCLLLVVRFWGQASALGMAHLVLEFLFVGGLGTLEWMFRDRLSLAFGDGPAD